MSSELRVKPISLPDQLQGLDIKDIEAIQVIARNSERIAIFGKIEPQTFNTFLSDTLTEVTRKGSGFCVVRDSGVDSNLVAFSSYLRKIGQGDKLEKFANAVDLPQFTSEMKQDFLNNPSIAYTTNSDVSNTVNIVLTIPKNNPTYDIRYSPLGFVFARLKQDDFEKFHQLISQDGRYFDRFLNSLFKPGETTPDQLFVRRPYKQVLLVNLD